MTQLRGWAFTALVMAMVVVMPRDSYAGLFSFDGSGTLGGFVWDGDADVGTMNNDGCPIVGPSDPVPCFSDVFTVLPGVTLADLRVVVTSGSPDFEDDPLLQPALAIAFTLSGVQCSAFSSLSLTCGLLPDVLPGDEKPTDQNSNDVGYYLDPTDPTTLVTPEILLVPIFLGAQASGGGFGPNPADFVGVDPALVALLNNSRIGVTFRLNANSDFSLSFGQIAPTAVPEPASLLLVGSGVASAVGRRYRRRSKTARS